MIQLLEQSANLLTHIPLGFKRYLFHHIRWQNRLIGIKGARGTGKTTMLLQWLKIQNLPPSEAAYFSLDDLYFSQHFLKETVADFYRQGGKILVLDEVHKYPNWSAEIKNCYDFYPDLKIIFTGSSIIDISTQQGDISRRAVIYELPGLSFREYLSMMGIVTIAPTTLTELLTNTSAIKKELPPSFKPLQYFHEYLKTGYYPFAIEDTETTHHRINQMIRTIVEYDMMELKDFDIRNAKKLLQLIYVIAQQVPFKPNITALSEKTGIHRNSINNYLNYLEQAKILQLLYPAGISTPILQKPEKIFLNNTTLLYALSENNADIGSVRETFFLSQLIVNHKVHMPKQGDFIVDNKFTFEVGGKNKGNEQVRNIDNAWIAKDDIDNIVGTQIPLWMLGMLY